MARLSVGSAAVRVRLLRAALRVRRRAHPARPGLRRQPPLGGNPATSRHVDRAGPQQSVPRPADRGEPRSVCPHARGRVSGRGARAAREDRHGVAESEHAGSDALPDPPRDASPHGRYVVHLPDVRLRAPPVRRSRADHALAVHARIRGSPAALRLARQQPDRHRSSEADRVRPPESELHGDEQAKAAAARGAASRVGVGRSADADDQRPQAPRPYARVDTRLLRPHRRRQEGERDRRRAARAQRARRSQSSARRGSWPCYGR